MSKIARFEAIAERLVEGMFSRLFSEQLRPQEVCLRLARAMEDFQIIAPDGTPQAPTHYRVVLHPSDYAALASEQPSLELELANYITELAAEACLTLANLPTIELAADATLEPHEVRVKAKWVPPEQPDLEATHEMAVPLPQQPTEVCVAVSTHPFLIVDGRRHVELLRPTVSVGRALDNDVILEDPRVSRHHVQLRRRFDRYVLYDLGSQGGTQINGYPVAECVLQGGDVISLAGVQVIYGEDMPTTLPAPDSGDTPVLDDSESSAQD